jgi:nitrate/TMAO reductase-like tetraheme cytochrome c subunit/mono/diheme cytochrome c family protein
MKRFFDWLKDIFFPPQGATTWRRIFPFALLGFLTIVVLVGVTITWDYTNSNAFCGSLCHTMPPQQSTYLLSAHAGVECVECHLGRAPITTQIIRKAQDGTLTFTAMVTGNYQYPLQAHNMRPASEACETCHYPAKFSLDSFKEVVHYGEDENNTPTTTYLILKTGGGSAREGLGYGIHWHIENPVYFYAEDEAEQIIPYVRVVHEDGSYTEYVDIESNFDPSSIDDSQLKEMDCITCHNRTSHLVMQPGQIVDDLLKRNLISTEIPSIKANAVDALDVAYSTQENAMNGISTLEDFYAQYYPDFYSKNADLVKNAVAQLQKIYKEMVFPEEGFTWESHPDNIGHDSSAGCFRCHGGTHFNSSGDSIRLECNICHSIPVVAGPDEFTANVEIDRGPEPDSHKNPNWITLHREIFNESCESCHTVDDPGGVSNTSFCSNSACHGNAWQYAGFDAPGIREALQEQLDAIAPTPEATEAPVAQPGPGEEVTYDGVMAAIFNANCTSCHGSGGMKGLNLSTYEGIMTGSSSGPVVIPGDPENSLIYQELTGTTPHFAQLTNSQLELLKAWIEAGAPEN